MIRAPLIQHTAEIRKNMALADLMIVTAAFMKWPFRGGRSMASEYREAG